MCGGGGSEGGVIGGEGVSARGEGGREREDVGGIEAREG